MNKLFEKTYPNITHFAKEMGYIDIGYDDESPSSSFIRVYDLGGMVWESKDDYDSLDEALQDLEENLKE